MPNPLHLRVFGHTPVGNPDRSEFLWNPDYTAYRVRDLAWWDEQSYAAYQVGNDTDHDEGMDQ